MEFKAYIKKLKPGLRLSAFNQTEETFAVIVEIGDGKEIFSEKSYRNAKELLQDRREVFNKYDMNDTEYQNMLRDWVDRLKIDFINQPEFAKKQRMINEYIIW